MTNDNPSILSQVSISTNELEVSSDFYDRLASLGKSRVTTIEGEAVAYGKQYPSFGW